MPFAGLPIPPSNVPVVDPRTGDMALQWKNYYLSLQTFIASVAAAPIDAKYWTSTANTILTDETNLGLLPTGYLKIVSAIGVATPSTVTTIPATDISSGAALTRTNDTNVTITLTGSPTTALLAATALTLGWVGLLGVARGGTAADNTTQTYTPTLTGVTNVASATAVPCQYQRVGTVVTVSGYVSLTLTAPATLTQLNISLPIPSAFTAAEQCCGTASAPNTFGYVGAFIADTIGGTAELLLMPAATISAQAWPFTFTYRVV